MRAEIRTGGPTEPDTRITVFGFIYLGVVANPFHDESCRTKTILANHSYASLAGWTFFTRPLGRLVFVTPLSPLIDCMKSETKLLFLSGELVVDALGFA